MLASAHKYPQARKCLLITIQSGQTGPYMPQTPAPLLPCTAAPCCLSLSVGGCTFAHPPDQRARAAGRMQPAPLPHAAKTQKQPDPDARQPHRLPDNHTPQNSPLPAQVPAGSRHTRALRFRDTLWAGSPRAEHSCCCWQPTACSAAAPMTRIQAVSGREERQHQWQQRHNSTHIVFTTRPTSSVDTPDRCVTKGLRT